mmetsp:Transcript_25170/g.22196  ORF Transcript_25170/g.22196 Transcript_25170/m.22196 type:complete len:100 (+) Transcript_25170:1367-1666(+)
MKRFDKIKETEDNKLSNILDKIEYDRFDTLNDKRVVCVDESIIDDLDVLKSGRIRNKFQFLLLNRKHQNTEQIRRYEEALDCVYRIPFEFPVEEIEFLH